MLIDYYENVKWLVLVHQSEAQNQNRSVEDGYSVTLGSLTAFAYVLKGILSTLCIDNYISFLIF